MRLPITVAGQWRILTAFPNTFLDYLLPLTAYAEGAGEVNPSRVSKVPIAAPSRICVKTSPLAGLELTACELKAGKQAIHLLRDLAARFLEAHNRMRQ